MNQQPTTSEGARAPGTSTRTSGKSAIASPKVTENENMELEQIDGDSPEAKLPLHQDIMQLARLGEIPPIQTLFEAGKYSPKYKDEQDITPLHVGGTHGTRRNLC